MLFAALSREMGHKGAAGFHRLPPCSDVVIYSGLSELRSAKRATQRVYLRRNKRIASDSEGAALCANVNLIIDEAAIQRAVELRQTIIWMGERITPSKA